MKYLHIFQIVLSCIFTGQISTSLFAQSPIEVTLECDSATTTIFYQDFVRVKVSFPDSLEVKYTDVYSSIEISVGQEVWISSRNPLQESCGTWGYMQNGQSEFGEINLPAIFFQKPTWFDSLQKTGGEISLRYRLICNFSGATAPAVYSDVKKMKVPAATKDDTRAMNYLMRLDKDVLQYFCWLNNGYNEQTIESFKFIARYYPDSVLTDIAKYHSVNYDINQHYEKDGNYQQFQPTAAKIYKELTHSKSAYLRLYAENRL